MQLFKPAEYRHVQLSVGRYQDAESTGCGRAAGVSLQYAWHRISALPIPAGGNTSSKVWQVDPLSGADVDVMYVKGSGGDLRTAKRENFASLYMDKLMQLQGGVWGGGCDQRREDSGRGRRWWRCIRIASINLNPRASSIDTPLHAFIPYRPRGSQRIPMRLSPSPLQATGGQLTREIYGDEVVWVDWQRPGIRPGFGAGWRRSRRIRACLGIVLGGARS